MFGAFRTAVCTRENTSSFFDLQSMLLVEENHAGASTSTHTDNKMLYMEEDRPVVVVDEVDRHAMETTDMIKTRSMDESTRHRKTASKAEHGNRQRSHTPRARNEPKMDWALPL